MDLVLVRFLFVLIITVTCYLIDPFDLPSKLDAALVGVVIGVAIVLFEWRLRLVSLTRLIGAAIGSILGIFGAYLFTLVIRSSLPPGHTQSFLQILVMLLMALCPSGLLGLADRLTRPAARGTADLPVTRTDAAVQSEGAR